VTTVSIHEAAKFLHDFHYVDPCWQGTAFVPFWGETLEINLDPVEDGRFTPRQMTILRAIVGSRRRLRRKFERRLFEHYQREVYGCIDFRDDEGNDLSDQYAPRLDKAGQIWKLIQGPEVMIDWCCKSENEDAIEFELDFTCTWDDEHGLGVRYRNWEIEYIGGWGG
jgi:hypothetical protein